MGLYDKEGVLLTMLMICPHNIWLFDGSPCLLEYP